MTYSKQYIKKFYSSLSINFLRELENSGLKIKDKTVKDNFYPFLTTSLKKALDRTFKDLLPPKPDENKT
jgi:hypothetical protein